MFLMLISCIDPLVRAYIAEVICDSIGAEVIKGDPNLKFAKAQNQIPTQMGVQTRGELWCSKE